MPVAKPFSPANPKSLLIVSLIGHYERTAQYLSRDDTLRCLPGVASTRSLRFAARSAPSLLKALAAIAWHVCTRRGPVIGIPRSNSRAITLLPRFFRRTHFFSYSDGLGDSIHRFFLQDHPNYLGHIGFPALAAQPLIHEIPLRESVEPWGQLLRHAPDGPTLVIVKSPKETRYSARQLARLHSRVIAAAARRGPVLVSGQLPGLALEGRRDVQRIGPLARLTVPLTVSGAIGLPSTAFLTLASRLPLAQLRVMRLCCSRAYPEASRRVDAMKATIEASMHALAAELQPPTTHGHTP